MGQVKLGKSCAIKWKLGSTPVDGDRNGAVKNEPTRRRGRRSASAPSTTRRPCFVAALWPAEDGVRLRRWPTLFCWDRMKKKPMFGQRRHRIQCWWSDWSAAASIISSAHTPWGKRSPVDLHNPLSTALGPYVSPWFPWYPDWVPWSNENDPWRFLETVYLGFDVFFCFFSFYEVDDHSS